ncbi:gluconokinase [Halomonas marinisediminis]|uniref:Gluconokinase n=1 Tax=Halomonas marinisediminis TaxID=2546095 RepID=A0ABY2D6R9_9GAMM|nr:gluconokinase [Halomonas marinisediminis]TDB02525.1 gluconokinase [Halomonas marinisediminis]
MTIESHYRISTPPHLVLVMGVSGSGKSFIGRLLAEAISADFIDADDHHSPTSIAKMSRGEPLTDGDREGWLATLADFYRDYRRQRRALVIGCSALKRRYRDTLRSGAPELKILYLDGSRELLLKRLHTRQDHFFQGDHMLDSQLQTLEPPDDNEALCLDIALPPLEIVERFTQHLSAL